MADSHEVEALLTCIDCRLNWDEYRGLFPSELYQYQFRGVGCSDEVTADRDIFYRQLRRAKGAGLNFIRLRIIDHTTCKAFGKHDSPQEHASRLRAARALILAEFPEIEVELYLLDLETKELHQIAADTSEQGLPQREAVATA